MCLYVDHFLTKKLLSEDKSEWIFYKLFLKRLGYLETPYQGYKVTQPGVVTILNPVSAKDILEQHSISIEQGVFHARVTAGATSEDRYWVEYFCKGEYKIACVPILVKKDKIVAFGIKDDIGITEYKITEDTWKSL
jgi:hypothetical protein